MPKAKTGSARCQPVSSACTQVVQSCRPGGGQHRLLDAVAVFAFELAIHQQAQRVDRDAGDRVFIEFHLEVDGGLPVSRGHPIADAAEKAAALFPDGAEVTAHIEPPASATSGSTTRSTPVIAGPMT
jgi:Dimerisation domain of Zinc Transporter